MDGGAFETTVDKYYGSLRGDAFLGPKWFLFAFTRQERDTFQDIDLRSNYQGGFGYQLIANDQTDLRFSGSAGTRIEYFVSGGSNTEAVVSFSSGFRQQLGPVQFNWDVDFTPEVDDFENARIRSDATATTALFAGLGFRVGLLNEFDGDPQPGVSRHDMLFTTNLTYTFGK